MVQSGTGSPRWHPYVGDGCFLPTAWAGGVPALCPPPPSQVGWFPGSCGTGATLAREPARGGQRGLSGSTPERSVGPFGVHRGTGDMSHPPPPTDPKHPGEYTVSRAPSHTDPAQPFCYKFIAKTRRLTQWQGLQEQGNSQGWPQHRRLRWGPWPQHGTPPGLPRGHPPRAHSGDAAPNSSSRLCPWR